MTEKLLQSPLFQQIRNYLLQVEQNQQIFLFVPYIKTDIIDKLLKGIPNQVSIITTWETKDLILGSSDIKLYQWCKDNGNFLYINDKIHLKIYSVNLDSAIVASGNISHNGLEGKNHEAAVYVNKLTNQNRIFLEVIKKEAHLVDDDSFQKYLENYEKWKKETPDPIPYKQPEIELKKDYFLKSELPMTETIDELVEGYIKINSDSNPSENPETAACIYHDIANYNIETGLTKEQFLEKLKIKFFSHAFIKIIDEYLESHERTHFGIIRDLIHKHCTDVPLPRPFEFNKNINIIYHWFVELGDGQYERFFYGSHTESLRKIKNRSSQNLKKYEKEVLEIIASPGKTINEIRKIYGDINHRLPQDKPTDPSELLKSTEPIWHFKVELNNKIKKIASETFDRELDDFEEKKIEKGIAYAIGKLEDEQKIKFWYHKSGYYSDGIWRLK